MESLYPQSPIAKQSVILFLVLLASVPRSASAHQPRIVDGNPVRVSQPEVSQAFYGELTGTPVEYQIQSDAPFRLYVGLLVPDIPGARKDISATIHRTGKDGIKTVAILDGESHAWKPFYEKFAQDDYFGGQEYRAGDSPDGSGIKGRTVASGTYLITVSNPTNHGKYALAIGDVEEWPFSEIISAAVTVPRIKAQFFGKSPLRILISPFGWGYVLILYFLAFGIGLLLRMLMRRFVKLRLANRPRNITGPGRLIRASLGLALLLWAITTSWHPLLILLSGFCFFEAMFSWCGLYAAIGKSSCPLK